MGIDIKWNGDKLTTLTKSAVINCLDRSGVYVEQKIKDKLAQPGRGLPYTRYSPKRQGVASAPGDPPHNDMSELSSHITHDVIDAGNEMYALIGTNVKYAKTLELGSVHIKPRPYLRVTLEESYGAIQKIFAKKAGI